MLTVNNEKRWNAKPSPKTKKKQPEIHVNVAAIAVFEASALLDC
jgi:hypothetical protein